MSQRRATVTMSSPVSEGQIEVATCGARKQKDSRMPTGAHEFRVDAISPKMISCQAILHICTKRWSEFAVMILLLLWT